MNIPEHDDPSNARRVFGYSRVSTEQQADNGDLTVQQEAIRETARKNGWQLVTLEEDIGSAHRKHAIASLPGLIDLLRQAKASSGMIIITDASRLSRNVDEWRKHILPLDVPVYSLRDERVFIGEDLEAPIRAAEAEAKRIGRGTKNALKYKDQVVLDSSEMHRRGSAWNVERQLRLEDDCIVGVQILRERGNNITAREFGEELVRRGRKPPRGSSFKLDTARQRVRDARKQLALEDDVDAEPAENFQAADLGSCRNGDHETLNASEELQRVDRGARSPARRPGPACVTTDIKEIWLRPAEICGDHVPTGDNDGAGVLDRGTGPAMETCTDAPVLERPQGIHLLRTTSTFPDAFKGRQRRATRLHAPFVLAGRPRPRPEPKERPPPPLRRNTSGRRYPRSIHTPGR